MLFPQKVNGCKYYELKCDVDKDWLMDIAEKFADDFFYLEIGTLDKKDKLIDYIAKSGIRSASSDGGSDVDIILEVSKNDFREMVNLIIQCNAEVVTFFFPNKSVSFEQYLYNASFVFPPQRGAIIKKLCAVTCTWVTNNRELYFNYDPSKYDAESIKVGLLQ